MTTLTHHKKGVRALTIHPTEMSFCSGSSSSMKQWRLPKGDLIQNLDGHNTIINTLAVSSDDVLVSGGDNGSMQFRDYKSGHTFQTLQSKPQPGSLETEAGIFSSMFDKTMSRLITGEADKSIKIWSEDETATPESHPIGDWKPKLAKAYGL